GQSEDGVDFGYDADVIYHEYGHAIIDHISALGWVSADEYGMVWDGGSLNEGSADAFSMFLTEDPLMGEYAGTSGEREGPIRDLEEDRRCPEDLVGEVHADGEIWGALIWNYLDDDRLMAEQVWELQVGAASTWLYDVNWKKAGKSLANTAGELYNVGYFDGDAKEAVLEHLETFNLLDCGRVIPLDDGEEREQFIVNAGLHEEFALIPLGTQFSLDVPDEADWLRFEITDYRGSEDLGYTLFMRQDDYIEHETTTLEFIGLAIAVPTTYDLDVEGEGTGIVLELDSGTDPPLEPGNTYYFSMAGRNLGGIELLDFTAGRITVAAEWGQNQAPPDESPKGCSCDGARVPSIASLVLILLCGLGFWRRK
ncbi:MAG: hypothetical protein HN348_33090, partial [Proteobacteria bacterium]|nr:hypothetical protein [Pseudomonadota bacterium]